MISLIINELLCGYKNYVLLCLFIFQYQNAFKNYTGEVVKILLKDAGIPTSDQNYQKIANQFSKDAYDMEYKIASVSNLYVFITG